MTIDDLLDALTGAAAARGTRALLVAESLARGRSPPSPPGTRPVRPPNAVDRADRLAARLGTENALLVHDARERLDPGLLAAEAGTVPAGGAVVLLVPPLERWAAGPPRSRFTARLVRLLLDYLNLEPSVAGRLALDPDAVDWRRLAARVTDPGGAVRAGAAPSAIPVALADQDALLRRLVAHLEDDPRALAVVEAGRGHGKSALLGRLAARLDADGTRYRVCAARRSALDVLARHRNAEGGARGELPFVAPDAAVAGGGDVLLVDEAASLSLPVIERLLGRWSRLVLATTSAGYESAGRAFALRLPAVLDRERPGWRRSSPAEPMRWRRDDPLDALVGRMIAPSAPPMPTPPGRESGPTTAHPTPPSASRPAPFTTPRPSARPTDRLDAQAAEVDRDTLALDESRLGALSGLLVATHYQSTPLDLAHVLDGENVRLWSIERDGVALAVALVAMESGVEPALHDDVLARRRRLPHDLLPQLLAQSADRADALEANLARVVRIAVRPDARRHGLASRLVERVARDVADDVEGIGASFGESPASVSLWAANGFRTFHRGYRRNPRSGQRSIAVLRATSARVRDVLCTAETIHRDNAARDDAVDAASPRAGPRETGTAGTGSRRSPAVGTVSHDAALLARFARGERSLSDTRGALRRLVASSVDRVPASADGAESRPDGHDGGHAPDEDADTVRWLRSLGAGVPAGRRAREARLRERVADRLAGVPPSRT